MSLFRLSCANNATYIVVDVVDIELISKLNPQDLILFKKLDGKDLWIRVCKINSIEAI